ncbi:MAG: hypothetical protein C4524_09930, partial [Candidatus Zixiibacteriota bacterium]
MKFRFLLALFGLCLLPSLLPAQTRWVVLPGLGWDRERGFSVSLNGVMEVAARDRYTGELEYYFWDQGRAEASLLALRPRSEGTMRGEFELFDRPGYSSQNAALQEEIFESRRRSLELVAGVDFPGEGLFYGFQGAVRDFHFETPEIFSPADYGPEEAARIGD